MIEGCRSVECYRKLNRIEEGTYGVVYKAMEIETKEIYALKRLKLEREKEGFPITSLREICALSRLIHPNIVRIKEIVVGRSIDHVFIVMEYIDHDLKSILSRNDKGKTLFQISEIKTILYQLLDALRLMHENWIVHRDLKTSNLLFTNSGQAKIADFGLARKVGSPAPPLTPIVVTLWYRAPEILLGSSAYSSPVDMWSIGCIFAELLTGKPLFSGTGDIDQLHRIFKVLGSPTNQIWPGWESLPGARLFTGPLELKFNHLRNLFTPYGLSDLAFDLLNRFLLYDPGRRITAAEALAHPWFSEMPLPKDPSLFPTWPTRMKKQDSDRRDDNKRPCIHTSPRSYEYLLG